MPKNSKTKKFSPQQASSRQPSVWEVHILTTGGVLTTSFKKLDATHTLDGLTRKTSHGTSRSHFLQNAPTKKLENSKSTESRFE